MYAVGMTINMIPLFALIVTFGIIVDDAIVVGEHADYRARKLHEPPMVAAERAAGAMGAPVMASTLTTIIALAALVRIGGNPGRPLPDTKDAALLGVVKTELIDPDCRPCSSFDVVFALQKAMPTDPQPGTISFRGGRVRAATRSRS